MNKKNLKLLVEGLKTLEPNQFDMDQYINDCGTVRCMVGWATTFKGLEPIDDDYDDYDGVDYDSYSDRVFETNSDQWKWCFSGRWVDTDNTVEGAIKRIEYLIENDDIPEYFDNDFACEIDPYCDDDFEFEKDQYTKMFYSNE